jgi:hypothetical protein
MSAVFVSTDCREDVMSLRTIPSSNVVLAVLAAVLVTASQAMPAYAQNAVAPAPIPPAFLHGKKVFVSNAGADSGLFPHPFSGAPSRAYDQFYAALQSGGRYELVSDPSNADLVFELQLTAPNGPKDADKTKGASDPLPMFRLVILDRPTHYILWALTESIRQANLQATHDRNFDDALAALAADLKAVTGPAKP